MITMSPGLIAVSLPTMVAELGVSVATVAWIQVGYSLVVVSLLVPFSRFADRIGTRRLYVGGLLIFGVAALLASRTQSVPLLICARFLQGLGAAMSISINRSILAKSVTRARLGSAMGGLQMASAGGGVLSLALGGAIVALSSWQGVFLVMAVGGLGAAAVSAWALPEDGAGADPILAHTTGNTAEVLRSAILFMVGVAGLMFFLTEGIERGISASPTVVAAAAFIVAGSLFFFAERRSPHPLISRTLLLNRQFSAVLLGATMSHVVRAGFLYLLAPLYISIVWGLDAAALGVVLVTVPLLELIVAPFSGRWADRSGMHFPTVLGMVLVLAALLLLLLGPAMAGARWNLLLLLAMIGGGFGLFHAANNSTAMRGVETEDANAAAGLLAMSISIGMVFGVVIATGVFTFHMVLGERFGLSIGAVPAGRSVLAVLSVLALTTAALSRRRELPDDLRPVETGR
jgi:MFS family permease